MADGEFQFERTFGWLMHDVQRLIRRNWARALKAADVGLSEPQARVLAYLHRLEDGAESQLTQTQLAAQVDMEKAPLGRLLDRMEQGGYIERRPDPTDRRARFVSITPKGAEIIPIMQSVTRQVFAEAFAGVPEAEIEVMLQVLGALKANLSPLEPDSSDAKALLENLPVD